MKHSLLFWSRKSHCWAGVYLSAVTLLWLGEMAEGLKKKARFTFQTLCSFAPTAKSPLA